MTKTLFTSSLLSAAREIISRAVDNIFRDVRFCKMLENDIYTSSMLDVVSYQRFTLNHWNCMLSCLHLLSYLKEHYNGFYNGLIHDDYDFSILDCMVSFYHINNNSFK